MEDRMRSYNISLIDVSEEKKESYFQIMADNFPKLLKGMNPQTQEM